MTTFNPIYSPSAQRGRLQTIKLLFLATLTAIGVLLLTGRQAAPAFVPDGLTAAEWESIQNQIAAAEYRVTPDGDAAYTAPNQAQGWTAQFNADGAQVTNGDWTWSLVPTGYGYSDAAIELTELQNLSTLNDTVTYQWDANLSEWWLNSPNGLEQGFTVQERPGQAQGQPLRINMAVSGSLTPVMDNGDVLFQDANGETILRYDRLHVVDANGQQVPAQLKLSVDSPFTIHHSPFTIQIVIDDAHAAYPLTIDPWLQQAN
ncbi:MAG: hypothetical protein H6662_07745 [Ardenticatenaceae bacterium]|nr:hypothetical protein [Ardenticatenaceae bacterium]